MSMPPSIFVKRGWGLARERNEQVMKKHWYLDSESQQSKIHAHLKKHSWGNPGPSTTFESWPSIQMTWLHPSRSFFRSSNLSHPMDSLTLLTWSEPSVALALHHPSWYTRPVTDLWACFLRDPKVSDWVYLAMCGCSSKQWCAVVAPVVSHARQGQN
jgi:hypothetical protein